MNSWREVLSWDVAQEQTWYAKYYCWSRFEEWVAKSQYTFPTNTPLTEIRAVLLHMAYFGEGDALQEYKEYLETQDEDILFFSNLEDVDVIEDGVLYGDMSEESSGAFGVDAQAVYQLADNMQQDYDALEDSDVGW